MNLKRGRHNKSFEVNLQRFTINDLRIIEKIIYKRMKPLSTEVIVTQSSFLIARKSLRFYSARRTPKDIAFKSIEYRSRRPDLVLYIDKAKIKVLLRTHYVKDDVLNKYIEIYNEILDFVNSRQLA